MPALCRSGVDSHIGHPCNGTPPGHPKPFHKTSYVAGQTKVSVQGGFAIRAGDATACGDPAVGCSSKVNIAGALAHRQGDATGGHACHFVPNAAASGSPKVSVGG